MKGFGTARWGRRAGIFVGIFATSAGAALAQLAVAGSGLPGATCPVTTPNGSMPEGQRGFNHGNGALWVALWWPSGEILGGTAPDGSMAAIIRPDGSIYAKTGWWRGISGRLSVEGERIDAYSPPLRARVSDGYGERGFQPVGLTFPTEGCWRITGRLGDTTLTFVVRVRKLHTNAPVLTSSVAPRRTITLQTSEGQRVTTLATGLYRILVIDRSRADNFHLLGPGIDKRTGVRFRGRVRWTVQFVGGRYVYKSDRHNALQRTFIVYG